VVLLNETLRVLKDEVFFFHHAVGRQAPLALAHAHAAPTGGEAHANGLRGLNAVVQTHTVGVDVEVVAAGGAAAHQEFGHGHLGAHLHHFRCQPGPQGVQTAQPAKQFSVLHGGNRPGERLEHVVVGVDQAWGHQMAARVNDFVCRVCLWG
jgi:hypothetical protein